MGHDKIIGKNGSEIYFEILLHPGEVLENELLERKITKSAFAMKIAMYPAHFSDIIKCKRNISANIALKLEKELNISAEFWLGLQMDYDLGKERMRIKQVA